MRKQITITKIRPRVCEICPLPTEFYISYRDPDNPGHVDRVSGFTFPTASKMSCKNHVAEVTAILLKENGLLPEPESIKP